MAILNLINTDDSKKVIQMKTYNKTIKELIDDKKSPLPIEVIPNYMGINLSSVDSISWKKQDDGQLTNLTINFPH